MNLKHKTSQALFAYWDKVRADRTTPRRFEIEPGKIAGILPSTFILERIDAETYRFRLAGTHVCELFGGELRGTNFLDGWSAADRISLVRHFAALVKQGAVETLHMEAAPVARGSVAVRGGVASAAALRRRDRPHARRLLGARGAACGWASCRWPPSASSRTN